MRLLFHFCRLAVPFFNGVSSTTRRVMISSLKMRIRKRLPVDVFRPTVLGSAQSARVDSSSKSFEYV